MITGWVVTFLIGLCWAAQTQMPLRYRIAGAMATSIIITAALDRTGLP